MKKHFFEHRIDDFGWHCFYKNGKEVYGYFGKYREAVKKFKEEFEKNDEKIIIKRKEEKKNESNEKKLYLCY